MRDIATTTLSGNLTRDVELRQLPSGADVARLRIATTTRRRSGEEWVDKTNYFTVEVFGAQARACAEYLAKGSRVFVDAEPDWREWTRPAEQQTRGGHLQSPPSALRRRPPRTEPRRQRRPAADAQSRARCGHPTGCGASGGRHVRQRHRRRPAVLMASRAHRLDGDRPGRRRRDSTTSGRETPGPRLKVAAVEELHLTVDYRSLCGPLTVEPVDVYQDEAGLRAWNNGPLEQCSQCAAALIAMTRRPAQADAGICGPEADR